MTDVDLTDKPPNLTHYASVYTTTIKSFSVLLFAHYYNFTQLGDSSLKQ